MSGGDGTVQAVLTALLNGIAFAAPPRVAANERAVRVHAREHAGGEVDTDRPVSRSLELTTQVAGSACDVEHDGSQW